MKKVIIIGGGVSGLSAGIYAQLNGYESTIYEKHAILGGACTHWKRKGYTIDGSISYLTGVKPGEDLFNVWQEVGAFTNEDIYYKEEFIQISDGMDTLCWYRDLDKLQNELIRVAPDEQDEIRKLVKHIDLMRHVKIPVKKSMEMMNPFDWLKQIKQMGPALKLSDEYLKITILELSAKFKNPLIRQAITSFVPNGFQAMAFMTSAANFASGYSAKLHGGAQTLITNLTDYYLSLGGKAYTRKGVDEIIIEESKATGIKLISGEHIRADYVIAACDPYLTFTKFLPSKFINKDYTEVMNDRTAAQTHSMSQIFFGVDLDLSSSPSFYIKKTSPYKDLNEESNEYVGFECFCNEENPSKTIFKVAVPTKKYMFWKNLDKKEYVKTKQEFIARYTKKLIELYPEVENHIEMVDMSTPLTIERYCGSYEGAYMGLELNPHLKKQYLSNKIKGLDNVVLSSQWSMLAGGLPTAVLSGKFAIQRLCKVDKVRFIGVS